MAVDLAHALRQMRQQPGEARLGQGTRPSKAEKMIVGGKTGTADAAAQHPRPDAEPGGADPCGRSLRLSRSLEDCQGFGRNSDRSQAIFATDPDEEVGDRGVQVKML